jgi:integrase
MASVRKRTWGDGKGGRKSDGRKAGESWEAQWQDGGKQRRKAGFRLQADALAYAVERQKEVNDGLSRPAGHRMTFAKLGEEFLAHTHSRIERGVIGPGHGINMDGHFRNYIARSPDFKPKSAGRRVKAFDHPIGSLVIGRMRPSTVEKFRDDLLATGLSVDAVRAIITTVHATLDFARRRDYVPTNVADGIKVERPRDDKNVRVTPPTPASLKAVIASTEGWIRFAVELSACTGIRAGELRALRYRHIDVTKRTLTVKVALNVHDIEGPPKSDAGYRTIPLSQIVLDKLEARRIEAGNPPKGALIFPPEGERIFLPRSALRDRLNIVLKRLGMDIPQTSDGDDDDSEVEDGVAGRFTWHALRHYAISSWIAQGMGLKAVQTFAGHADVATTWNRYGHLFPEEDHWTKITAAAELTLMDS